MEGVVNPEKEVSCPACGEELIVISRKDWEEIVKELDEDNGGKPSWQAEDVPYKPYYGRYASGKPKSRFVYRYNKR